MGLAKKPAGATHVARLRKHGNRHRVCLPVALKHHVVRTRQVGLTSRISSKAVQQKAASQTHLVAPGNARKGPVLDGGHVAQDDRRLRRVAREAVRRVVELVVEVPLPRVSAEVQAAAGRARPLLLDVCAAASEAKIRRLRKKKQRERLQCSCTYNS